MGSLGFIRTETITRRSCCEQNALAGQELRPIFGTAAHAVRWCMTAPDCLVHLYWPDREEYFQENIVRLHDGNGWLFVATPGHGLRRCQRPTINFMVGDERFADGYLEAAKARGLRHGIIIQRSTFNVLTTLEDYELAPIGVVSHPNATGQDASKDWKFDIGKRRHTAVDRLSHAGFIRLATPHQQAARSVVVPQAAILLVW